MGGPFEEFHAELRGVAREVLASTGPGAAPDRVAVAASGWAGLEVPEDLGGSGATFAEVAVVLEEMGRALAAGPFPSTAAVALGLLAHVEAGAGPEGLCAAVAAGEVVPVAVGAVDPEGVGASGAPRGTPGPGFRVTGRRGARRLRGAAAFVPDAPVGDRLLVVAEADGATVVVDLAPTPGAVEVVEQPVLDATRCFGRVAVDDAPVADSAIWPIAGDPDVALSRVADRAAVAVASDSLGIAVAMMDATVAYASARHQFGRPIGSFQAVKHACADMAVAVALSRELVDAAVAAVVAGAPDAWVAASMAKAHVTAAAVDVAGSAMQLHGGIGYTWESGIHAYLKRAVLNRALHGSPAAHRARLASRYAA